MSALHNLEESMHDNRGGLEENNQDGIGTRDQTDQEKFEKNLKILSRSELLDLAKYCSEIKTKPTRDSSSEYLSLIFPLELSQKNTNPFEDTEWLDEQNKPQEGLNSAQNLLKKLLEAKMRNLQGTNEASMIDDTVTGIIEMISQQFEANGES